MKKTLIIIIVALVLAGAGLGFWAYSLWNQPAPAQIDFKPLTPEERASVLGNLEASSSQPAAPVSERESTLNTLEASSTPVATPKKQRISHLQELEAASKH